MNALLTEGARVVITGGADGIGLGIARKFVGAGAIVRVCDFNGESVSAVNDGREGIKAVQADVSDPRNLGSFFDAVVMELGGIDILVNNVGVAGPHAFVEDMAFEDWDLAMRTNVSGMFYAIKAVVGGMKERRAGAIVNISSAGTLTLPPKRSVYNTSKAAVEGMTRSLARELGPFHVRCNAILPGVMNNTRMVRIMERRAIDEARDVADIRAEYLEGVSMNTLIDVDDVGDLAVFLSSPQARFITGQLVSVCGGLLWEH